MRGSLLDDDRTSINRPARLWKDEKGYYYYHPGAEGSGKKKAKKYRRRRVKCQDCTEDRKLARKLINHIIFKKKRKAPSKGKDMSGVQSRFHDVLVRKTQAEEAQLGIQRDRMLAQGTPTTVHPPSTPVAMTGIPHSPSPASANAPSSAPANSAPAPPPAPKTSSAPSTPGIIKTVGDKISDLFSELKAGNYKLRKTTPSPKPPIEFDENKKPDLEAIKGQKEFLRPTKTREQEFQKELFKDNVKRGLQEMSEMQSNLVEEMRKKNEEFKKKKKKLQPDSPFVPRLPPRKSYRTPKPKEESEVSEGKSEEKPDQAALDEAKKKWQETMDKLKNRFSPSKDLEEAKKELTGKSQYRSKINIAFKEAKKKEALAKSLGISYVPSEKVKAADMLYLAYSEGKLSKKQLEEMMMNPSLDALKVGTGNCGCEKPENNSDVLYDSDINELMEPYAKTGRFLGVYMADTIDKIPTHPNMNSWAVVMNTDKDAGKGKHWVSVMYDKAGRSLLYCDSFGESPTNEFMEQIKPVIDRMRLPYMLKFKINRIRQQSYSSKECGWFSLQSIHDFFDGKPFKELTGYSEVEKSEEKLKRFKERMEELTPKAREWGYI